MGTRGNIGIQRTNYNMKSKRRKLSDKEIKTMPSGYTEFTDHTQMKTHEYAAFQKELFIKVDRERIFHRIRVLVSIVLTILFLCSLPYLFSIIFN